MDRLGGLWWFVIAGWLWTPLPLFAASDGLVGLFEWTGLFLTGGALALVWLSCSTVSQMDFTVRAWLVWMSVPTSWLIAFALALTNLPLTARLVVSEGTLKEYAASQDPDPPNYVNSKVIGAFVVDKVWRHGRTVAFGSCGQAFITTGVIYAPDGLLSEPLPMEAEELLSARYTHLYGAWYRFEVGD